MTVKESAPPRTTFKQDFFRFVADRVAEAGRVMPGCDAREYESLLPVVRGNLRQAG